MNRPPKPLALLLGLVLSSVACTPTPSPATSSTPSSPVLREASASAPSPTAAPNEPSARPAEPSASPSASSGAPASRDACTPSGDWANCVDKVTRVVGTKAVQVMQHPSSAPLPMPGSKPLVEDYVDVEGRQIVVVLEKEIACPNKVEVVGSLVAVALGGAAGTKGSYSGFRIERASARCL